LRGIIFALGFTSLWIGAARQPIVPRQNGGQFASAIRSLIVDSLKDLGHGRSNQHLYWGADSSSQAILRATGLRVASSRIDSLPLCTGSVKGGVAVTEGIGFRVQISLRPLTDDRRDISISVSCRWGRGGRLNGFAEGGKWELRRVEGQWRVTQSLDHWIT
jgi:hypothetical protein